MKKIYENIDIINTFEHWHNVFTFSQFHSLIEENQKSVIWSILVWTSLNDWIWFINWFINCLPLFYHNRSKFFPDCIDFRISKLLVHESRAIK